MPVGRWQQYVKFDPTLSAAHRGGFADRRRDQGCQLLGWRASVHTDEMARIMVDADMAALECEGKPWIDKPMIAGRT